MATNWLWKCANPDCVFQVELPANKMPPVGVLHRKDGDMMTQYFSVTDWADITKICVADEFRKVSG